MDAVSVITLVAAFVAVIAINWFVRRSKRQP